MWIGRETRIGYNQFAHEVPYEDSSYKSQMYIKSVKKWMR